MEPDEDIRLVEQRIAQRRNGLAALAADCEEAARDAIASPKSLLAVAAAGFVLGEMLRPPGRFPPTRKAGLAGILLGAAVALVRARYGNPWSLVEFAWPRGTAARGAPRRSLGVPAPSAQQRFADAPASSPPR